MNAALAMIEAAAPRDEIEGALAVQMARTLSLARLRRPPEDKAQPLRLWRTRKLRLKA